MGDRVERLLEVHKAHIELLLVLACLVHQYSEIHLIAFSAVRPVAGWLQVRRQLELDDRAALSLRPQHHRRRTPPQRPSPEPRVPLHRRRVGRLGNSRRHRHRPARRRQRPARTEARADRLRLTLLACPVR